MVQVREIRVELAERGCKKKRVALRGPPIIQSSRLEVLNGRQLWRMADEKKLVGIVRLAPRSVYD